MRFVRVKIRGETVPDELCLTVVPPPTLAYGLNWTTMWPSTLNAANLQIVEGINEIVWQLQFPTDTFDETRAWKAQDRGQKGQRCVWPQLIWRFSSALRKSNECPPLLHFGSLWNPPLLGRSPSDITEFDKALLRNRTYHTRIGRAHVCCCCCCFIALPDASPAICDLSVALKTHARPELKWPPEHQPLMNKLCNMSVGVEWRASVDDWIL